ncbi:hypothetical protein EYF80_043851 [Liparis tanakae]|uniref:Uncharacterized protein n=1 Tax=Liparis tanakae TaxID=230148 RepID=A0A4Z2FYI7_9TELE|nr:hypothetical protein EYF80_043851 [Liparis tanakae]
MPDAASEAGEHSDAPVSTCGSIMKETDCPPTAGTQGEETRGHQRRRGDEETRKREETRGHERRRGDEETRKREDTPLLLQAPSAPPRVRRGASRPCSRMEVCLAPQPGGGEEERRRGGEEERRRRRRRGGLGRGEGDVRVAAAAAEEGARARGPRRMRHVGFC